MLATPITEPTILICGHASRDARCGILGPLLQAEFHAQLARAGVRVANDTGGMTAATEGTGCSRETEISSSGAAWKAARVGLVSHIGGHKWAGNVIVYFPAIVPQNSSLAKLASKGVWYGRVEPCHVEGIVRETVLRGRVIEELCRGVRG